MKRVLLAAFAAGTALLGLPLTSAAAADVLDENSVTVTINDVSPTTPVPSDGAHPHPLTVSLTLQNNTAVDIKDLTVQAVRRAPIYSEAGLDTQIAAPTDNDPTQDSPVRTDPLKPATLLADGTESITYRTQTSTTGDKGICVCYGNSIYPLYFFVTGTDPGTGDTVTVGAAQTYLPAFYETPHPAPLLVSWIWPLLDRPHRVSSAHDFLDDDLAAEVAPGGRLDRALAVVEKVAPHVPLTLMVDPDLLDELEVMSSGHYTVRTNPAKTGGSPGTGAAVAQAWLLRFTTLLDDNADLDVQLTPFGDPAVDSLARNGLTWAPVIGDQETQARVAAALGNRVPEHNIYWPVGSTLGQDTLTDLVQQGISTVVVDDSTLPRNRGDLTANALAQVPTSAGPALAAVTSKSLEDNVWDVVKPSGRGLGALPELVAHLALRVIDSPDTSHYVVLAPPRGNLNVDPDVAARAIRATTTTLWSKPITLADATQSVTTSDRGVLHQDGSPPSLPPEALAAMQVVEKVLPGLTGKYGLPDRTAPGAATSATVVSIDKMPVGVQRSASSAFVGAASAQSTARATKLADIVTHIRAAVHLVHPAGGGSYTLTSNDAPLPVTIANALDVPAQVRVHMEAVGDRPGFSTETVDVDVPANSTQQFRIPTHVSIAGRIDVSVTLSTLNNPPMAVGGGSLDVSVRNTALGTVGVAITTIAAVILGIALLFRAVRAIRWRIRRRQSGPPPPVTDPLAP